MKISTYITFIFSVLLIPVTSQAFDQSSPPDSLVVDATGKVGIGTSSPSEALDLSSNANGGFTKFVVQNTADGGNKWAFSVTDGGASSNESEFRVSKQGSGGPEFTVNQRLDGNATGDATLVIDGSVAATNVTFTSSRKLKTDFMAVDTYDVLDRVAQLEMSSWRYKKGSPGKHIGPIAEDFEQVFELGNSGETISVVDSNGVALAAIQGLYAKMQTIQAEIVKLRSQLEQVK